VIAIRRLNLESLHEGAKQIRLILALDLGASARFPRTQNSAALPSESTRHGGFQQRFVASGRRS
jgi:hypothetical protein